MTISSGGQMKLTTNSGRVLRVGSVNIGTVSGGAFDGGVDLTNNAMIVDYSGASPLANIKSLIRQGTYNGVTQSAAGIVSSTAIINGGATHPTTLGFGEASALGVSIFEGQSVDSTSILIRYTYVGDGNLDGTVNALDFNALASNYGQAGKTWTQGDYTNDGIVNSADFAALAANYGQVVPSSADTPADAVPLGAVVPEPAMGMSLIAIAACSLTRQRRS
jgi:hypothetical protein